MDALLITIIILLYLFGGTMAALLAGWEANKTIDAFKFIFWPITIWFE
jgi:hypothetical protein